MSISRLSFIEILKEEFENDPSIKEAYSISSKHHFENNTSNRVFDAFSRLISNEDLADLTNRIKKCFSSGPSSTEHMNFKEPSTLTLDEKNEIVAIEKSITKIACAQILDNKCQ